MGDRLQSHRKGTSMGQEISIRKITNYEANRIIRTGKPELFKYIMSARIGYAMQGIFERLEIVPEADMQMACCEAMWDAIFRIPIDYILHWASEAAESLDDGEMGNC